MSRSRCAFGPLLVLALFALGGCAARQQPAAPRRADAASCAQVDGLAEQLRPGTLLFFGEIHGSVESPALVGDVACAVRAAGLPLVVGLEIPVEENALLQAYLTSAGTAADRRRLLAGAFWMDSYQDGRRSEAMAALLERLRELSWTRGGVTVVPFDSTTVSGEGEARDAAMAERLAAVVATAPADAVVVATCGNVHSRTHVGVPWDAAYRPMAFLTAQRLAGRRVVSFAPSSPKGTAWTCDMSGGCGPHPVGGSGHGSRRVELLPAPVDNHDGRYQLASLTASPPAARAAPSG